MARTKKTPPDMTELRARREVLMRDLEAGVLSPGETVRRIRGMLGLTVEQYGKLVGLSKNEVSKLENEQGNPTRETLELAGKPLGLTVRLVPRRTKP